MLAAEFGYLEPYIDEYMTLDKFSAHMRYRNDCPPIGMLFKAFCGIKTAEEKEEKLKFKPNEPGSFEDFIAAFSGAGGSMQ